MWVWWCYLYLVFLLQGCIHDTDLANHSLTLLLKIIGQKMNIWTKPGEGTSWNFTYKCHEKENISSVLTSWKRESLNLSITITFQIVPPLLILTTRRKSAYNILKKTVLKCRIRAHNYINFLASVFESLSSSFLLYDYKS